MKLQRRFAPTGGEFAPESVARFIGIYSCAREMRKVRCRFSQADVGD
jgi:hypothetical protein